MQNFGKIKNHFNSLLSESITTKDNKKRKLFKEYVRAIKKNEILKAQFMVYNNIERKSEVSESKASEFVKANIEILQKYSKEEIFEANLSLCEPILFEKDIYQNELGQLHEDITTLIFTENNPNNVDERVDALTGIVGYVNENVIEESVEPTILPNSVLANIAVDKFNDRYEEDLNEDEKSVLKTIIESDNDGKEELFKSLSRECITLVNESLTGSDVDTKEKLLEVKDKILRLEYSSDSFITNISKLIELKGDLSE